MIFNEMPRCLITVENSHEACRNIWRCNIGTVCWQTCMRRNICVTFTNKFISSGQQIINFYGPWLFTHSECHYASLTI
ncbi:Prophage DLP12 integrase [Escherichia coli P12b]|nr:Prophage DLP12 integrase [Escherichia coli P12b]